MLDLNKEVSVTTDIDTDLSSHECFELIYITAGSGHIYLKGIKKTVEKNDYFIVDYGVSHRFSHKHSSDFEIISISFYPGFIDHSVYNIKNFTGLANSYLIRFNYRIFSNSATNVIYNDKNGSIFQLFNKSLNEFKTGGSGFLQCIRCHLVLIILEIMRTLLSSTNIKLYDNYVKYINDVVDVNYMKPLKLSDFAKELNYSVPYLSRRFKQVTNMTFIEFLQMKRIEQSCKLLESTDKNMFEIAGLVGYSDMKYFYKTFKKYMKMTPRDYRKMVTQNK